MTKFERAMLFNCPACRARVSGRVVGMVEVQPQLKTPEELEEMILDPARTALVGAWWGRLGGDGLVGTARMFPVSSRIRNLRSKPETCRLSLEFPLLTLSTALTCSVGVAAEGRLIIGRALEC